jgi:hypothetical protein
MKIHEDPDRNTDKDMSGRTSVVRTSVLANTLGLGVLDEP